MRRSAPPHGTIHADNPWPWVKLVPDQLTLYEGDYEKVGFEGMRDSDLRVARRGVLHTGTISDDVRAMVPMVITGLCWSVVRTASRWRSTGLSRPPNHGAPAGSARNAPTCQSTGTIAVPCLPLWIWQTTQRTRQAAVRPAGWKCHRDKMGRTSSISYGIQANVRIAGRIRLGYLRNCEQLLLLGSTTCSHRCLSRRSDKVGSENPTDYPDGIARCCRR